MTAEAMSTATAADEETDTQTLAAERDPNLAILLDRIVAAFRPEAVYLFGSRAEGRAAPDSDYDLFVVVPDDTPREKVNVAAGYQAKLGTKIAADIFPCWRWTFEKYKEQVGTLSYIAWHRGKLVYGA